MFERFSPAAISVIDNAYAESLAYHSPYIGTEHILLALAKESSGIPGVALAAMKVTHDFVAEELAKMPATKSGSTVRSLIKVESEPVETKRKYSPTAIKVLNTALDQSRFFGQKEVLPEHLLLALCDIEDGLATQILEDQGANITLLCEQVMHLMAEYYSFAQTAPSLRSALSEGLSDLIAKNLEAVDVITALAAKSGVPLNRPAERINIVRMVFIGYMKDFLSTQVAFQRYLLQQSLTMLQKRTGTLDEEMVATIVSNSAQHLRFEVRSTIEFLWSHEYRLLNQILDEAEHDLIGSVIEDLFWAHSEGLALAELYENALKDHRRKHVLSLQKRRRETAQRISRLCTRLDDTIRQCFVKRSISA
jgi:hypothetical protein